MACSTLGAEGGEEKSKNREMDRKNLPPALAEKPAGLPPGKYKLVGWDMDTTGRRLIDEICQIAAYTPRKKYAQYIMPNGDLNPGARRRHNVRVVTIGRYRMLQHTNNQQVLKTKSEISALVDFMDWLEYEKKEDEKVILIYHEPRRLSPTMLIKALIQYNLLDRFKAIVSGFTDSYALSSEKCKNTLKSVSLRVLARLLLPDEDAHLDTAMDRAIASYKIVEQLANQGELLDLGDCGEGDDEFSPTTEMVELAREFARPISTELEALNALKDLLERQNTFRAVFRPLLRSPRTERQRLTHLRRILADAGLLYDQLKDAWHEGRRAGLVNLMSPLVLTAKEEDLRDLVDIFDCHFDPKQVPHYPLVKKSKPKQQVPVQELDELYLSSDSYSSGPSSVTVSGFTPTYLMGETNIEVDFY